VKTLTETKTVNPIVFGLAVLCCVAVHAEQHNATHLGNPATRFAPPVYQTEDLRARFRDEKLWPDIASILHQWGWTGNLDDLLFAAHTNQITEAQIPVHTVMPFMSSREGGKPVCLRNVTWAGKEPISAYAFTFTSKGRRYRCVTPKPCSNFFLEDLGPEPRPVLALDCSVPEKVPINRPVQVCLTVRNTGNLAESLATVGLPIPQGTALIRATEGGMSDQSSVTWQVADLATNAAKQLCAVFTAQHSGPLSFISTVASATTLQVQSACSTTVFGIPGILLEKKDEPDPIGLGSTTTYTVKVTNQGTADHSNVQVVVTIAPELVPVSCSEGTIDGQTVSLPVIPTLPAKQAVSYTIVAKGVTPGDGRTTFALSSDALQTPVLAVESTTVY
jgi:uncharacterized repeat protein (TIGR01451 family)